MSGRVPVERSTMSSASSITSRLRSPRKSIFNRPISSTGFIVNWVTVRSTLSPFSSVPASATWSGTMSVSGRSAITTAAAWIEEFRTIPSSPFATSMICAASGSLSTSALSGCPGFRHSSKLGARPMIGSGISFASLSPIA